jgi:hypothetical protein
MQAIIPKEGVIPPLLRGNHLWRMPSLTIAASVVNNAGKIRMVKMGIWLERIGQKVGLTPLTVLYYAKSY